jgi:lysophospholipase L1-like esterase
MKKNESAIGNDNVETGLARLAELKSEHGFEVLVTLWPHFSDTHIHEVGEMAFLGHRMNPGIHEFAKRHELKVFPLAPAFKADLAKYSQKKAPRRKSPSPRWSYTQGDGTHPSKRGAEIAAVALSEEIKALLQRERRQSPKHGESLKTEG